MKFDNELQTKLYRGFIQGQALVKATSWVDNFAGWFDRVRESFSYKEVQFETFCPPVKTS